MASSIAGRTVHHVFQLIGNGGKTRFWQDPWLPVGRLIDQYGQRPIYDLGMRADIRASEFICHRCWQLLATLSTELIEIYNMILSSRDPKVEFDVEIVWSSQKNGQFSIQSAMSRGNQVQANLDREKLVWFKGKIAKHSVCLWMALRNGLKTKDLLVSRGLTVAQLVYCVGVQMGMLFASLFNALAVLLSGLQ